MDPQSKRNRVIIIAGIILLFVLMMCSAGLFFYLKEDIPSATSDTPPTTSDTAPPPPSPPSYSIAATKKTYDDAKASIRTGCSMISKKDVMENHDNLVQFLSTLPEDGNKIWVDAGRAADGSFKWDDGTPMTMGAAGHWHDGEPNNAQGGTEDRVEMHVNGLMNDNRGDVINTVVQSCPT